MLSQMRFLLAVGFSGRGCMAIGGLPEATMAVTMPNALIDHLTGSPKGSQTGRCCSLWSKHQQAVAILADAGLAAQLQS